jgi:glycosyltransferase involved in cell wall biosynthesis
MKVALVSSDNSELIKRGGKHIYQSLIEKFLSRKGIEVTAHYPGANYYNMSVFRKANLALRHRSLKFWDVFERRRIVLANLIDFFNELDLVNEDIVHCQDVISALGVHTDDNMILTIHGYFAFEIIAKNFSGKDSSRKKALMQMQEIEETACYKSRHIICVDQQRKEYLIERFGIPPQKITVLHNAVDTDEFSPVSDDEKLSIRRKLGFPESKRIVLIPARFSPEKGVVYAAKASWLLRNDTDILFIFAGGGPQRKQIESITHGQENVLILDTISHMEICSFFKAADVVLIPSITFDSIREGTSMSLLEGMACGKVVIATRVGGIAEVIEDGHNGFFVEEGSAEAIRDILIEFSSDISYYSIVGRNAQRTVLEKHSFEKHIDRLISIYNACLMQQS